MDVIIVCKAYEKFQTHGTAMGTKMAVSFENILMAEIETKII